MTAREPIGSSHPSGEPLPVRVARRGEAGGGYRVAAREERFVEVALERYGATRTLTSTWITVVLFLGGLALLGMGGESMRISGWGLVAIALVACPLVWRMRHERIGFVANLDVGVVELGAVDRSGRVVARDKKTLELSELRGATTESIEDSENEWVVVELVGGKTERVLCADRAKAEHLAERLDALAALAERSRQLESR
ncbi:MAG: hypothetical protein MUE69_13115 [Myxococcota bacterium]|jgi:hypothetical protein|nr:hypothetical protein [Myxococcota bacterium]